MSRSLHCRPSDIYKLDGLEAYAFDSAVVRWGTAFEAAIAEAANRESDGKKAERAQQRVIRKWLPSERKYADPNKREL